MVNSPGLLAPSLQGCLLGFDMIDHHFFLLDLFKQLFLVLLLFMLAAVEIKTGLIVKLREIVSFLHYFKSSFFQLFLLFSLDLLLVATLEDILYQVAVHRVEQSLVRLLSRLPFLPDGERRQEGSALGAEEVTMR